MDTLKFGTSGLRGLVTELVGWPSYAYTVAFLRALDPGTVDGKILLIGRDLRPSSPDIAAAVAAAAAAEGFTAMDCGMVPTPALALEAMRRRAPAVMITGSHIPDDRNGLKFYHGDGEITKTDEAAILKALPTVGSSGSVPTDGATATADASTLARYRARYTEAFGSDALAGLRVAVYQQTSVARDLLGDVLSALGAEVIPLGRSDRFVPIDTEAHRPEDIATIRAAAKEHRFDALVTTDGDADRPLMADADGLILRGDVVGLFTARVLGADTCVVPVTAGSAIERVGGFSRVIRTKVGSPHVIAGMAEAMRQGATRVIGFEANGGFLLGSDVTLGGRSISALPTRDAMLPIIATLVALRGAGKPLSDLVRTLDAGETASDRLQNVSSEQSGPFLAGLGDDAFATRFVAPMGEMVSVSRIDGTRIALDGHRSIHFRASGNAPELRCYAEASTASEAEGLVRQGLAAAAAAMNLDR